jgi:CBS domain-containing protein
MSNIKDIIKKNYEKIDENESISNVLSKLKKTEGIIILKDDNYKGILDKRDISRAKISPETKAKTLLKNVAKISSDENIEKTAGLMLESDSYVLPVFEKDRIIGVVIAEDILRKAVENDFGEEIIKNYMSTPVIKITPDSSVGKAIKIFKEEDISRLPVYEDNKLYGIITLDDVLSRFINPEHRQGGSGQYEDSSKYGAYMVDKKEYLNLPVTGFMSETFTMFSSDEKVKKIVSEMLKHEYRGILIGENNQLEGIVTKRDLLEPLATSIIIEPIVIQFSGDLDKIKDFNKRRPKEILYESYKKYLEYLDNVYIYIRLKQHYEQSKGRHIIFCKMRLSSPRGMFIASDKGWGFIDAINKASESIEKQIRRTKRR